MDILQFAARGPEVPGPGPVRLVPRPVGRLAGEIFLSRSVTTAASSVGPVSNSREATFAFERKRRAACIRDKEVSCDALKATSASMDP